MSTSTTEIEIYEGRWRQKVYTYALSEYDARQQVISLFAFGDPEEDDYAIGNYWATSNDGDGWRITNRTIIATNIYGRKNGNFEKEETVHLNWECPYCNQCFSEDIFREDKSPLLFKCECRNEEKCFLVSF